MADEELDLGNFKVSTPEPDYLPYSNDRVKRMVKECGCHLENIWAGYKGNRYPGYVEHYCIINDETKEIINGNVTLEGLRYFFARQGFPLEDEFSMSDNPRNQGAEAFMEAVGQLTDELK